ncbi:MAG: class I SAM-dependent methyltransferase [Bacteroidales bacterium]|nr:class I SAM-dependent methyltransferase [Bacteroidales bacterium]
MRLKTKEVGKLGLYEFQGYLGAMTSPTFGGWEGTERLFDLLDLKNTRSPKILEVGCSTGYITRYLAKKYNCDIVGIDLSQLLLDIAKEESDKTGLQNIRYYKADVANLPFSDNTFDIVFGQAITALVPEPIKVINEYFRVLKPGGKMGIQELFMKMTLSTEYEEKINGVMSNVVGSNIRIRNLQEWEHIFCEAEFSECKFYQYSDKLSERDYSFNRKILLFIKLLYYFTFSKEIRKKIWPTLKFANSFRKLLKSGHFAYFIALGTKV